MSAAMIMMGLEVRGASLTLHGGQLRYWGPRDALTDELRAAIANAREDLVDLLGGRAQARLLDDGIPDVPVRPGAAPRQVAPASPTTPAVRPSLRDLAARYRQVFGRSCKAAYRELTGVDLDEASPDWPDLETFDTWLHEREGEVAVVSRCDVRLDRGTPERPDKEAS